LTQQVVFGEITKLTK